MKEFWLPVIIAFAYFFALCAAVYYCSQYISLVRERQWRRRNQDLMHTLNLLREADRRKTALLEFYERGRYQGDYQGEESDEILSAEVIGND